MDNIGIFTIKFTFIDGSILTITDKSFRKAVEHVMTSNLYKSEPIKILFPTTKKILYFDKQFFQSYLDDNLEQPELIELTQCDGLYRNKIDLEINKNDIIDSGSLFKLQNDKYILVDDNRYVPFKAPDDNFIEI